jgi:hypothetical protein
MHKNDCLVFYKLFIIEKMTYKIERSRCGIVGEGAKPGMPKYLNIPGFAAHLRSLVNIIILLNVKVRVLLPLEFY